MVTLEIDILIVIILAGVMVGMLLSCLLLAIAFGPRNQDSIDINCDETVNDEHQATLILFNALKNSDKLKLKILKSYYTYNCGKFIFNMYFKNSFYSFKYTYKEIKDKTYFDLL